VQDLLVAPLYCPVEGAVSVHYDEAEGLIVDEELVEVLGVELVVAEVEGGVDGLEGLKVNVHATLLSLVGHDGAAVEDETVLGALVVQLETLLGGGDGWKRAKRVRKGLGAKRRAEDW